MTDNDNEQHGPRPDDARDSLHEALALTLAALDRLDHDDHYGAEALATRAREALDQAEDVLASLTADATSEIVSGFAGIVRLTP